MKDKNQNEHFSDIELMKLFKQVSSPQEKLQYFSKLQDVNCQMELLNSIPIFLVPRITLKVRRKSIEKSPLYAFYLF